MYGISEKELIANQGKITPEQQIKNLNELRKKALVLPFDIESVDPFCNACVLAQLDKYDKFVDHSGNRSHGKFQINCEGINIDILDENLKSGYSEEEWDQLKAQADIVYWAKKYLKLDEKPWTARWYQEPVLRCTSKRKALRVSRRAGKTSLVCIEIVYYLFTNKNIKIIIAGPQKVHTEEIIKRTRDLIQSNPELANCIVKDIQAPYYLLRLSNGSELRGFAAGEKKKTGGTAVRGQDADRLYLEEMQYISEEAILGAVYPILQTHPDTFLVGFSTPNSMRTPFYSLCKENPMCKEFHYTYRVLPHWKAVEADRGEFTEIKWNNEFEAEFGESEAGVYKPSYIDASMQIYKYSDYSPTPGWKYCIGTDWNEKYGTEIVVLGWSPFKSRFIVVDTIHIEPSQFTQLDGINKLLDLNRKWLPEYIYIDSGNGCLYKDTLVQTNNGVKEIKDISVGDMVLSHNGKYKETLSIVATGKKNSFNVKVAFSLPLTASDCHTHIIYRSKDRFNDFENISSPNQFCSSDVNLKEVRTDELDVNRDFFLIPKQKLVNIKDSLIVDLAKELKDVPNLQFDDTHVWTSHGYSTSNILSSSFLIKKYNTSRATVQRTIRKAISGDHMAPAEARLFKKASADYGNDWYLPKYKKISRFINILDKDFLNLYGWYLSEGYAGVNNIEICQMPSHYKEEFDNLIDYCSSSWDCNILTKKNGMRRLFILSSLLSEFFKRIGGSHCYNKFIDKRIFDNNGISLLPSLFWGDGHEHEHGVNLSLTSNTLVMQVRQMLINNGILSGLHRIKSRKRSDGYKDSTPQLMLYLNANKKNHKKINLLLSSNVKAREGIYRRKYIELDDCFLVPLKKIDYIGEVDDMFDLMIDQDASFCANGIATHNSTNNELLFSRALKARGIDEPTARLLKTLKKYDSGASILTKDPLTKQDVKKPAKAFMVNASVRAFEQGKIIFSAEDTKLEKQLRNYIIERYTPTGNPVFGLNEEAIGDHRLDALNLAIVAFHLEFDDLYKAAKNISMEVYSAPDPRSVMQQILRSEHSLTTDNNPQNRRLEDPNISVSNYLAGINIPGKIDKTLILKTNRLGWDTDEEEKYSAIARQRKNSRLKLSRNRPQRTNF